MKVADAATISTAPATVLPDGAHVPHRSWLDNFRRITTSGEFIPEIDGLRFIAISVVVLRHVAVLSRGFWLPVSEQALLPEGVLKYGRHGVELFFVISGFILSTPFALQAIRGTRPVNLKRYFLRRLTRLEPPYLLSMVIYFALKQRYQPGVAHLSDLGLSLAYMAGIVKGHMPLVSTVAWSLEVEIQFYLLMPLLGLLFWIPNRWGRRTCLVLIAAIFISVGPIQIRGLATGELYDRTLLNYIQYFLAGLLLADVYATEWNGAPPALDARMIQWGDFVWLIGWPALLWVFMQENQVTRATAPPLIFLLYLSLFCSGCARRIMRLKWLTIIGGMCYSIYLMHNLALEGSLRLIRHWLPHPYYPAILILGSISIPLLLIECGIYFRLIERPCMRPDWPRRLMGWIKGAGSPPSQTAE